MDTDLIHVQRQCESIYGERFPYSNYCLVYPYTTENIAGYLPDVTNARVLSVVGSGDHYLNLIGAGAKSVDSFDINKFAIYYLELKKAAVQALSIDELYYFLNFDGESFYPRVRKFLDETNRTFWDFYIKKYIFYKGILDTSLFYPRVTEGDYTRRNLYLNKEGLEKLKKNIKKKRDEVIYQGDLYSLVNIFDKKYDYIFLSNINSYQNNISSFLKLVSKLYNNNLESNGELYSGYYYCGEGSDLRLFQDNYPNTEVKEIPSIYNRGSKIDKVMILKK